MEIKRITIRVSPELHGQLTQLAADRSVSLNRLAEEALANYVEGSAVDQERFPLRQLSAILAPAAEAAKISEEELLGYSREVRRRIWQERYEARVQSLAPQQAGQ